MSLNLWRIVKGRYADTAFSLSIAVIDWGKGGTGHVGFVVGNSGDLIYILGGNQKNAVNIIPYNKSKIVAYVVPEDYTVSPGNYHLDKAGSKTEKEGKISETR